MTATSLLAASSTAVAHGGAIIASGENDLFKITVQASDARTNDGDRAVDLTAYPVRKANGAPALDAQITFGIGPRAVPATRAGDGLEAVVALPDGESWREQEIEILLTGNGSKPLTIVAEPVASASDQEAPAGLIPATAVLLAGSAALVLVTRHRRRTA